MPNSEALIKEYNDYRDRIEVWKKQHGIFHNDIKKLESKGVGKLFGPGTPIKETVDFIVNWVNSNRR